MEPPQFEDWLAPKFDEGIELMKDGDEKRCFKDLLNVVEVLDTDAFKAVSGRESDFIKWFYKRTKYKLWVKKNFEELADIEETQTVPVVAVNNSARQPLPTKCVNAISSDGAVVKSCAKVLHWHSYHNQMLLDLANYLGADYMPIIADITTQMTGRGSSVLPSFSFIVDPNEIDMYRNVEKGMIHVVKQMTQKGIHMKGIKGKAKLDAMSDGRYKFIVSIDQI